MTPIKTLFYCTVGTMLEWYDFAIFGALSPTLSKIFFPHQDKLTSLMLSFAIFATGFIMRPIGGILLGHIGDKHGRKQAIIISVFLMTIATSSIGFLPTHYGTTTTAIVLLLLRLLQGISVGGEYPGFMTFSSELGMGKGKLFFFLGIAAAAVNIGVLLGTIIGAFFLSLRYQEAWRFPFFISIFLGIIGLYLRSKACESPIFKQAKQQQKIQSLPIKLVVTQYYKRIIWITFMFAGGSIAFYFIFIYYPSFIHLYDNHNSIHYLLISNTTLIISIIITLISGAIMNRKLFNIFMLSGMVGLMFLAPIVLGVVSHYPWLALSGQILLATFLSPILGMSIAFALQAFPTEVRYTCLAIILSLTGGIFGGTCPLIATFIASKSQLTWLPGLYLSIMEAIAIIIFIRNYKLIHIEE